MKTYLNVPYSEKDAAKLFCAKWDAARRLWFAPGYGAGFERWFFKNEPIAPPTHIKTNVMPKPKSSKYLASILQLNARPLQTGETLYLVKTKKPKQRAHIFDVDDTLCKMLSTGGLGPVNRHTLVSDYGHRQVCAMCQRLWDEYGT